jgi:tetratricopeptide (TPR) repeat protein/predicted Ser/Thr protein kinase
MGATPDRPPCDDCLANDTLLDFVAGRSAPAARARVERHVGHCPTCRVVLSELAASGDETPHGRPRELAPPSGEPTVARRAPPGPAGGEAPAGADEFGPGTHVGRYFVLARVGSGGMGVVYAAYDPALNRRVALKFLRPGLGDSSARVLFEDRLRREAQALARLAHPNVVAVYDVGRYRGRVFVAMEFVEGETLARWLERERRPPARAVLDRYVAAGRGLSAAHAAGLVHRDFKPQNVLVSGDGRVRVVDFGLARLAGPPDGDGPAPGEGAPHAWADVTATGDVLGTPLYMAPEQRQGRAADARSDQYSFCIALYEALYGERPPAAAGPVGGGRGTGPAPSALADAPTWPRRHLLRGLSDDPAERFPTMEALLDALRRDPRRAWRRRAAAAAGALAAAAAGAGAWTLPAARHPPELLCKGAERKLAGVWDAERKEQVRRAFLASGKPYAGDAWRGVERALDAYAAAWTGMHAEACEATRLRGEQTEEVLGLRMACLERRLDDVRSLAALFARAEGPTVERALQATGALGDLEGCARTDALTSVAPPPRDDAARAEIADVRARLSEARARLAAGQYAEARSIAGDAEAPARRLRYRPLEAEALLTLGEAQWRAGDPKAAEATLTEAAARAEAGRHHEAAGNAWALLTYVVGSELQQPARAHALAAQAESVLEGHGGDEAQLRTILGIVLLSEGKYADALAQHDRAVALREADERARPWLFAQALNNRANVLLRLGRLADAAEAYRRSFELDEHSLGAEHPLTAIALDNLGIVNAEQGLYEQALSRHERALAVRARALGPEHPEVASSHNHVGIALAGLGRYDLALEHYGRALAIREAALGPRHPEVATVLSNAAAAMNRRHDSRAALALGTRALAIKEEALGPEHPGVADTLINVAEIYQALNQHRRALSAYERALAIDEVALGPDNPKLADELIGLGEAHLALHTPAKGAPPLERAERLLTAPGRAPALAKARFALARALTDASPGPAPRRALDLASQARETLATAGGDSAEALAAVNAWLVRHEPPPAARTMRDDPALRLLLRRGRRSVRAAEA